jgi:hypothetical protein
MIEQKTKKDLSNRGFRYERRPDGRVKVVFKVKVDRQRFEQKLLLPKGVTQLEPAV